MSQVSANISIGGNSSGSIAVGANVTQQHLAAPAGAPRPEDWQQLDAEFSDVRDRIDEFVVPEQAAAARERLEELHGAIIGEEPDLSTMEYVSTWFGRNLPHLVEAVSGLVANPVVKAVVAGAGDVATAEFRRRFPHTQQ